MILSLFEVTLVGLSRFKFYFPFSIKFIGFKSAIIRIGVGFQKSFYFFSILKSSFELVFTKFFLALPMGLPISEIANEIILERRDEDTFSFGYIILKVPNKGIAVVEVFAVAILLVIVELASKNGWIW